MMRLPSWKPLTKRGAALASPAAACRQGFAARTTQPIAAAQLRSGTRDMIQCAGAGAEQRGGCCSWAAAAVPRVHWHCWHCARSCATAYGTMDAVKRDHAYADANVSASPWRLWTVRDSIPVRTGQ